VPGLAEEGVTSLSELAGREVTVEDMAPIVARRFAEVFGLRFEDLEREWPTHPASTAAASAS
jgi:lipoate-protein ligase B